MGRAEEMFWKDPPAGSFHTGEHPQSAPGSESREEVRVSEFTQAEMLEFSQAAWPVTSHPGPNRTELAVPVPWQEVSGGGRLRMWLSPDLGKGRGWGWLESR